jgi:hypothetical protein
VTFITNYLEEGVIGDKGENVVIYRINYDKEFVASFTKCLMEKLSIPISDRISATKEKRGRKTDIIIFDDQNNRIGLSLKTRKPGRPDDHLDRRWLDKDGPLCLSWKKILKMPENVFESFKKGLMEKARNTNVDLIRQEDQPIIKEFLLSNLHRLLEEVFRRDETRLQLFAVLEYEKEKSLYVFRMDDIIEFVEKNVKDSGIKFGRVIMLGEFLWLQRKAGDGKHIDAKLPKTHPDHPGNQIQVKVLPIELMKAAVKCLSYCKFEIPTGLSIPKNNLEKWLT